MSAALFPLATLSEIKKPVKYSLIGGPFGSKLGQKDYEPHGIPVIRGANLPADLRFSFTDFVFVSPAKAERDLRGNRAFPGDIVVTQRGTLGQVGLIPGDSPYDEFVLSQSQMKLTVDDARADADFVYYALKSPLGQHEILSRALIAGVPHINLAIFGEVTIPLPPLPIQRKIASVLSAYDDLIENNRRRIKVLEEMAQRIYREWFVDFRYPGYEAVPLVDSEWGPIPECWECSEIGEVVSYLGGGTPSKAVREYWINGDIPWFTPTDLTSSGQMFMTRSKTSITPEGLARSSARMFPSRSVMLTSRATIGVVAITTMPACTNQGFITCIPNERLSEYHLYFWLNSTRETIIQLASGATYKEINKATFRKIRIAVPPLMVEKSFADIVRPIGDQILALQKTVNVIRSTRDFLLPRLVSGAIDVDNLSIAVPNAA
jgi:type I restriction enzyme S subunit